MTVAEKLTGPAFEAALAAGVRKDSYTSLNKCENAMKRVLKILGVSGREVADHIPTYQAFRDRVYNYSKTL